MFDIVQSVEMPLKEEAFHLSDKEFFFFPCTIVFIKNDKQQTNDLRILRHYVTFLRC